MASAPTELQAKVIVSRNFAEILTTDEMVIERAVLHVDIDPITKRRVAALYTDDGAGNGDCIFQIELS